MINKLFYTFLLLLIANQSLGCKDRKNITEYPFDELTASDLLAEVKVSQLKGSDNGWYPTTESFKATILQKFKGDFPLDKNINVSVAKEEAHAVCPVHLEEGKIYILVLRQVGKEFEISRFDVVVNNQHENYEEFIRQIKNRMKK